MKKLLASLILITFLISLASAEIVINKGPEDLYNLGDTINLAVKITTLTDKKGTFTMGLICNGVETEVYKADVDLKTGEEQSINPLIILEKNRISQSTGGICRVKSVLGEELTLTNEFTISNLINVNLDPPEGEFLPGENVVVEGSAIKENGQGSAGFVELTIPLTGGEGGTASSLQVTDTIKNGFFSANLNFPKNMPSGKHAVSLVAYEKDSGGQITNTGVSSFTISIKQVPTSLELLIDSENVEPGRDLEVQPILHDQTGAAISSLSIISVKNSKNTVLGQREISTDETFNFPIAYNQAPEKWTVVAVSNKLTSELSFNIVKKQDIKTELINKTLIITNIGNIPYNNTIMVKIGNKTLEIFSYLEVDEIQKYTLTAPDGRYNVEILKGGETALSQSVLLTGSAIDVKRASGSVIELVRHPWVWIFIIFILGFMVFMVAKKGYKKSFVGYIHKKSKKASEKVKEIPLAKSSLVKTKHKAILSLSLKGNKQVSSTVCLKIKSLHELQSKKSPSEETIQRIVDKAEEVKASVYEAQNNIFFILSPEKTKTFKNNLTALNLALNSQKILKEHNSKFKDKIEYGIGLNTGNMIAKHDKKTEELHFMSLGTFITGAKKVATVADKTVLLSPEMNEKLRANVGTEKQTIKGVEVFTIKKVKTKTEESKKFIGEFLHRMEKDSKK